jgi:multicomponent Na+:H+ antiporter subunit C
MVMAIVVGGLFACSSYLMLARSIVKLLFGLMLLSHAANLLIFVSGGLTRAIPPLIPHGQTVPEPGFADPLPQALVLTALVISFAMLAFMAVLVKRAYGVLGTDDSDRMRGKDG